MFFVHRAKSMLGFGLARREQYSRAFTAACQLCMLESESVVIEICSVQGVSFILK